MREYHAGGRGAVLLLQVSLGGCQEKDSGERRAWASSPGLGPPRLVDPPTAIGHRLLDRLRALGAARAPSLHGATGTSGDGALSLRLRDRSTAVTV